MTPKGCFIMKQKTLSFALKALIIGVAICCAVVYAAILPALGHDLAVDEFASWYLPWYLFLLGTALPVAAALVLSWIIASNIGRDRSFCMQNAKLLAVMSILAAADTAYFFIGNVVFMLLNMTHGGVILLSLFICMVGVGAAVVLAALSHYARKAAELKEQTDLTI